MFELVLRSPEAAVEPASDALVGPLGALSVSVEDADAGSAAEQALFGEPGAPAPPAAWPHSTLSALFGDEAAATAAAAWLLAQPWADGVQVVAIRPLPDTDWVRLTQSQFEPVAVAEGFWVVPSWHEVPAGATRVIRIDPGLAFGTGAHPTTLMCLRWIAAHAEALAAPGARLLDYGCGSGILAIGAARFGAADITAVDIDPAAVRSTVDNARANDVVLRAGAPELARGAYDVVVANILATPLKLLAPLLAAHVAPGGRLVLAGLLDAQADELARAYAPWIDLRVADRLDGWALLAGQRGAASSGAGG